jgi:hypothetical protein
MSSELLIDIDIILFLGTSWEGGGGEKWPVHWAGKRTTFMC